MVQVATARVSEAWEVLARHGLGDRAPLGPPVQLERRRDGRDVVGRLVDIGEAQRPAKVVADPRQRGGIDPRPDVVEHQAADRRTGLAGEIHPDQTAHRGADPVDLVCAEAPDQRHHVGRVLRHLIKIRIPQPVATAPADDVGTDDTPARSERLRQKIEVAPDAGQAVDADQDVGIVRVTPLGVCHQMKPGRAEAFDGGGSWFHGAARIQGRRDVAG